MSGQATAVVGVAILRGGRVLAARRARPVALAGRWELPGGKVEPHELPEVAAVREVEEELGCTVEVTDWLDGAEPIGPGLVLRVATARLVAGDPVPAEHDVIRWLDPDQLESVDWLPADVPFLPELRKRMTT